jgi:hypothetical protein
MNSEDTQEVKQASADSSTLVITGYCIRSNARKLLYKPFGLMLDFCSIFEGI